MIQIKDPGFPGFLFDYKIKNAGLVLVVIWTIKFIH